MLHINAAKNVIFIFEFFLVNGAVIYVHSPTPSNSTLSTGAAKVFFYMALVDLHFSFVYFIMLVVGAQKQLIS